MSRVCPVVEGEETLRSCSFTSLCKSSYAQKPKDFQGPWGFEPVHLFPICPGAPQYIAEAFEKVHVF